MKKENNRKYIIISIISVATFVLIWELLTDVLKLIPKTMFPSPIKIVTTFFVKFYDPNPEGATMFQHIFSSLRIALTGYTLGIIIGVPLGISMAWFNKFEMFFRPVFDLLRPLPGISWIPLMIILFGIGIFSKAMVIFLTSFVANTVNSYSGIKMTRSVHLWVGKTFGASNLEMLFKIAIPTALPLIFTGLKVSLGVSWATLVAAELLASTRGLGFMIQQCRGIFRTDVIIVGMLVIGGMGAFLTYLITVLEKKILKGGR
ncbi:MAG: ABC transporter permease [Candidatus Humimicrobiaceae bacterium]